MHIESLFSKCRRLSFFIKRLRSYHSSQFVSERFVDACVLPILLYCSPVIFCGLLKKDFIILRRAIKTISHVSGLEYDWFLDRLIKRHFASCDLLTKRILADAAHPLHDALSTAKSLRSSTRSAFNLLPARLQPYAKTGLPYLTRYISA